MALSVLDLVVNSDEKDNTVVMLWININSKLVWECQQSLVKLVEHKRIQLVWVPGHNGIDGNEKAQKLARIGCSHPLKGPQCAIGTSTKVARVVIKD
jgi:ribonuclease HI